MSASKLSDMMNTLSKLSVESNVLQYLKDKVNIATSRTLGTVKPDNSTTILAPKRTASLSHYTTPNTADKLTSFEEIPADKMMLSVDRNVTTSTIVISKPSVSVMQLDNIKYLKFIAVSWLNPPQTITDFLIAIPELDITHTTRITTVNGLFDLSSYTTLPETLTITVIAVDALGNRSDSNIVVLSTTVG